MPEIDAELVMVIAMEMGNVQVRALAHVTKMENAQESVMDKALVNSVIINNV